MSILRFISIISSYLFWLCLVHYCLCLSLNFCDWICATLLNPLLKLIQVCLFWFFWINTVMISMFTWKSYWFGPHIGWVFAVLFALVVFTFHSDFYAMWKLLQFCWSLCFEFEPYSYVCSKFILILEVEFKNAFVYFLWKLHHQFLFFVIILWCGAFMLDSNVVWTISYVLESFFLLWILCMCSKYIENYFWCCTISWLCLLVHTPTISFPLFPMLV